MALSPGFRECFSQAIRVDEDNDWSSHCIDYSVFKERLCYFRERRKRLKYMLKHAPNRALPEKVVSSILGPKATLQTPHSTTNQINNDYVPFVDAVSSMDEESVNPSKPIETTTTTTTMASTNYAGHNGTSRKMVYPPSLGSWHGGVHTEIRRINERSVLKRLSCAERNEVVAFLSRELDKVLMFYMAQWQNLSRQIEDAKGICHEAIGAEILELLAFCTMNIVAVRQCLIRYDAFARIHLSPPMLEWYMKQIMKASGSRTSFRKLLEHPELKCLMDIYKSQFSSDTFDTQGCMFYDIMASTERAESVASKGHVTLTDNFIQTLRDYFLLGMVEEQLGLQSEYLTSRGQSLAPEMNQIAVWRKQCGGVHEETTKPPSPRLSCKEIYGLLLNLLSAFLYCMNYYIVEPSSTKYVNALGAPDNFSGLLIGMMPIAALSSAVAFSVWTNHSFRAPLLTAGACLITGNVMYATALKQGSIALALLGRFMTGLGGPKCIVRRFMADTVPITLRTGVNAAFGMSIAVGSALGPATAILVDQFKFSFHLPLLGKQYFNGMTGPGWFMAMLWSIFTIIVLFTFGEPDRSGLEEQKRLEEQSQGVVSPPSSPPGSPVVMMIDKQDSPRRVPKVISPPSSSPGSPVVKMTDKQDSPRHVPKGRMDEDLHTIFTNDTVRTFGEDSIPHSIVLQPTCFQAFKARLKLITLPVRLCLFFLFCKTFCIEALVSATSSLTKNRYEWQVLQVGTLGCINGLLVVPLSIIVGWLSLYYQDRALMMFLVSIGCAGMFLLIDFTDLISTPHSDGYNDWNKFAVHPPRYVTGYFLSFCSIQCFEGVIGSTLSKVIPTALASGTFNSGLLATLVDTLGRAVGDIFIFVVGSINIRQLMNLLFIPAFTVLLTCLILIRRNYTTLAV